MSFNLANKIRVVDKYSNIDEFYGPYNSTEDAILAIPLEARSPGRTVGVISENGIQEYWWKEFTSDEDLVIKNNEITKVPKKTSELQNDGENGVDPFITQKDIPEVVGDKHYEHDQPQPLSIWTIYHPLNKKVSVYIIDTAGSVVEGKITINDGAKVVIEFNVMFCGKAILN